MHATTPQPLTGQIVVITGAAGDLGWAIGQTCLAAGARVALCDQDLSCFAEYAATDSADQLTLGFDLLHQAHLQAAIDNIVATWGRVDVLINNAATVTQGGKVCDLPEAHWRAALDINLTGAWRMSCAVLPHMRRAHRRLVLNMASQLGHVAAPGRGAYGVSKAALIALTRAIAIDYADEGIRSISLSPGAVLTRRILRRYGSADAAMQALAGRYPANRLGTIQEIAQTALFLMRADAGFMTGTDVRVDGGYTAQ